MLELIRQSLRDANVDVWSIEERITASAELFFIRRNMDMRRMKQTRKYFVTAFRAFEKDGKPMLGSSRVMLVPSQTKEEVDAAVRSAFFAASFVTNPAYPLPEAQTCEAVVMDSSLNDLPIEEAAMKLAEGLFAADCVEGSILNSAEIFVEKHTVHLLTSWGTDVCYTKYNTNGEYVAQCKQPQDVEMHHAFRYDDLAVDALREEASEALRQVRDRAVAGQTLPSGSYDLILSGKQLEELLSYFTERTHVAMVFPGYSNWKPGTDVQAQMDGGERLNITLHATVPYSDEGIAMKDRPLITDGKVQINHGGARLSAYMGVPATGDYRAAIVDNGTVSLDEMKKTPYLYPVSFSDFQMDGMSGHFGGEIRLAYYFDGQQTHIVTGGSVNGVITDCLGSMVFSTERHDSTSYHGPFAVKLPGIKVAGSAQ